MLEWQWKRFEELSREELYEALSLRCAVFVVEQRSPYLEPDRGRGLGEQLIKRSLERLGALYPGAPVRISAQVRQQPFYERFGFHIAGKVYDGSGVPHMEMLRPSSE